MLLEPLPPGSPHRVGAVAYLSTLRETRRDRDTKGGGLMNNLPQMQVPGQTGGIPRWIGGVPRGMARISRIYHLVG